MGNRKVNAIGRTGGKNLDKNGPSTISFVHEGGQEAGKIEISKFVGFLINFQLSGTHKNKRHSKKCIKALKNWIFFALLVIGFGIFS